MADERFLATLWKTIEARRDDPAAVESYTRALLAAPAKARRKVVEEAYEVAEAQQGLLAGQDTARAPGAGGGRPRLPPVRGAGLGRGHARPRSTRCWSGATGPASDPEVLDKVANSF